MTLLNVESGRVYDGAARFDHRHPLCIARYLDEFKWCLLFGWLLVLNHAWYDLVQYTKSIASGISSVVLSPFGFPSARFRMSTNRFAWPFECRYLFHRPSEVCQFEKIHRRMPVNMAIDVDCCGHFKFYSVMTRRGIYWAVIVDQGMFYSCIESLACERLLTTVPIPLIISGRCETNTRMTAV